MDNSKSTHDYATPWHVVPGTEQNSLCWEVLSANGQLLSYRATVTDEDKRFMYQISAAPEMAAALREASAAIEALQEQVDQMRGMFDEDEDSTIAEAYDAGDDALSAIGAALKKSEGRE